MNMLATTDPVSLIQVGSSLGFAGLAWYLIVVRDPKMAKENAEERERMFDRITALESQHRDERNEWSQMMNTVSERSAKTAQDGHKAASELVSQLAQLREQVVAK